MSTYLRSPHVYLDSIYTSDMTPEQALALYDAGLKLGNACDLFEEAIGHLEMGGPSARAAHAMLTDAYRLLQIVESETHLANERAGNY